MGMAGKGARPPFGLRRGPARAAAALLALLLAGFVMAWATIDSAVERERAKMLFSLHLRAQSLAWAAEGFARFLGHGHARANLSEMFTEMGRQPGVAWIALVGPDGRIRMDSNAALIGKSLYTQAEMAELAPNPRLQARFSPDDPDILETWKLFTPFRFAKKAAHAKGGAEKDVIFVCLDAASFQDDLASYAGQLWLLALLLLFACASLAGGAFFLHFWRASRGALLDARALSQQVAQSYPAPLLVTDLAGQIKIANAPARELLGAAGGDIRSLPGLDWREILEELAPGRPILAREVDIAATSGQNIPMSLSGAVILDGAGQAAGWLICLENLSEIKRLQRKLAESQRLSALGQLAAGIAHEIRNPLSSICGYAAYLRGRLDDDPMGASAARLLEEEAQRLNSVLCDVLGLTRRRAIEPAPQPLAPMLEKLLALIGPDAEARGIRVKSILPTAAPLALVDRDPLLQALLNLALNAVEAAPQGGNIEITAQFLPKGDERLADIFAKGAWLIQIRDDGAGMSGKVLRQIFTPYFTTRANGTGLGLTLARQIVEEHGGAITVASAPGQGATFSVFLPAAEEGA